MAGSGNMNKFPAIPHIRRGPSFNVRRWLHINKKTNCSQGSSMGPSEVRPEGRPPPRPIRRLLVANRGEIAARILATAREHDPPIETFALFTEGDSGHILNADHGLKLENASTYLDIDKLLTLVREHHIDAIHPGYGFLSEDATFAKRAWDEAGASVIGPGWGILDRTGDKLKAKELAKECNVPVLDATTEPMETVEGIRTFVDRVGIPVMLKAVDGGGGRGIRLVRRVEDLENLVKRAIADSPSKKVFVEKAAIDGFRHIEVQILGDGTEGVRHLFERECSIQRRYQKIVELAPSTISDRGFIARIIRAAERIAEHINYFSLGTFEFLANPETQEFFFLEINPRLQVEHTITESLSQTDIVELQLRLSEGWPVHELHPIPRPFDPMRPPARHSIQLRICAENPNAGFSLSIGRISRFQFPAGNGIRVDTALVAGHEAQVSTDFDSVIAKIIITAHDWEGAVRKARRALEDTYVAGVQTNISVLGAIVHRQEFMQGQCDTAWLESSMADLVSEGEKLARTRSNDKFFAQQESTSRNSGPATGHSSSAVLFRKGDAWSIKVASPGSEGKEESHHLKLEKVLRNEFPSLLNAQISYATPDMPEPQPLSISLSATSATSASTIAEGKHRRGDPRNECHVIIPFPGKLIEVLVDEGDQLKAGDVVCIVSQMKMELEVRCRKAGRVSWVMEARDGEDVAEGDLAVEIVPEEEVRPKL